MSNAKRADKIELYGDAYRILMEALARLPKEMWHFKASLDDWSVHEIVVHITDSEANSFVRCRRLIAEPGADVMAYDENGWMQALRYSEQSTEDALELFKWLRLASYKLIKTVPESAWSNTIHHPDNGTMSMDDWLDTYARHIPDHIEQMERGYAAWKRDDRPPTTNSTPMSFSRGNAEELLQRGLAAARTGNERDYEEAEYYLEWVLRTDADLDQQAVAWYWLSRIAKDAERKRECLENVLAINPSHPDARRDRAIMEGRLNPAQMRANPLEQGEPVIQSQQIAANDTRRFKCPKCGATASFDPNVGQLRCQFCGTQLDETGQIAETASPSIHGAGGGVSEQDWVAAIYTETGHRWALPQSRVLECQGCGATVTFAPALASASCSYCGAPYVICAAEGKMSDLREPDGVITFAFDEAAAANHARNWLGEQARRLGVPDDLPDLAALSSPRPQYMPLWTFDINGEVRWSGFVKADMDVGGVSLDGMDNAARMGGVALGLVMGDFDIAARSTAGMASKKVEGNNMVYSSGAAGVILDDIQVPATKLLPDVMLSKLHFSTNEAKPYRAEMLAKWPAEVYSISMSDASLRARDAAVNEGDKQIALNTGQFDDTPSTSLTVDRTSLAIMSYKLLLVPVYAATYTYRSESYHILVNGQTGDVTGEAARRFNPMNRLFNR